MVSNGETPALGPVVKDLLARNHADHAILHDKVLHNHIPHLVASIFLLGGTGTQLGHGYQHESQDNEPWPSTLSVTINSADALKPYLGYTSYQKPFIDFFDSELLRFNGDWKSLLLTYLLQGPTPLLSGLVGGFGHPLILLADACELQSPVVAVEALALTAADWNDLHKILVLSIDHEPPVNVQGPHKIIRKIAQDPRFGSLKLTRPGVQNTKAILSNTAAREFVMECLFMLDSSSQKTLLSDLAGIAVLFECCGQKPGEPAYDFYLNHALTFVYSLHVLLPVFGAEENALMLIRCVWLLMILSYVTQQRPLLQEWIVEDFKIPEHTTWQDICSEVTSGEALHGKFLDPHFLRAVRNLKELGNRNKHQEEFYLKAAMMLKTQWNEWTGFGRAGAPQLNVQA
ncbi:hypothetical protein MMC17_009710 [Xylographa soralifera]|nr:hypothetical protein [Xylographa soralifera]